MPSSPSTPTRRPKSSSIGVKLSWTSASPQSDCCSSKRPSNSRTSSQYSLPSPSSNWPDSSHEKREYFDFSHGLYRPTNQGDGDGFGNLADELADAFEDEDENEDGLRGGALESVCGRAEAIRHYQSIENEHPIFRHSAQKGSSISISSVQPAASDPSMRNQLHSIPLQTSQGQSSYPEPPRKPSQDRDDDSNFEIATSPILEACLAAVEGLACRGSEVNGSDADKVVQRVAESLKNLGSQAGVENYAMRLITAHTALTTRISHQTRTLLTLTHSLVSPLSGCLDPELIDDLLALLTSLVCALPATTSYAFLSLHKLHNSTSDLTLVLTYLSDTLHMMRQTTSLASRRLRGVRDLVFEMRREIEVRERGILWVEKGKWEGRLAGRECAKVCGEVVGGFEEVCALWREKLVAGVEVGAA